MEIAHLNIIEAAAICYGDQIDYSDLDRAKARQKLKAEREIEALAVRTYTRDIATLQRRLRLAQTRLQVLDAQLGDA